MKDANLRNMLKGASKCVCTSIIQVPHNSLSLSAAVSSCMKTPENMEEDPYDLKQWVKEISKWNTPLIACAAQVQEQ
jgi:hypothetical protein